VVNPTIAEAMTRVPDTQRLLWLVRALLLPSLLYRRYRAPAKGQEPRRSPTVRTARPGYDALTDLANERRFIEHMSEALARAQTGTAHRYQSRVAVFIIALEGLEFVNDRFSTEAGMRS